MISFETSDQKEVRRFRIAQFNGRAATVKSGERTITLVPSPPKSAPTTPRSAPRFPSFAEQDFY